MAQWLKDTVVYLWMLDFFAWGTFCWLLIKDKRVSSSFITATVVLIVDGLMPKYGYFLETFYNTGHTQLIRVAYYGGFALFDVLAIWIIFKAHKMVGLDYRFLARTYLLAYFVLAWVQIIRLAERLYFDSNTLKISHQVAVASINMGTAVVGALIALIAIYMHLSHRQIGGKIWKV